MNAWTDLVLAIGAHGSDSLNARAMSPIVMLLMGPSGPLLSGFWNGSRRALPRAMRVPLDLRFAPLQLSHLSVRRLLYALLINPHHALTVLFLPP